MDHSHIVVQIAALVSFVGIAIFFTMRSVARRPPQSVAPGLQALWAGFMQTRANDESEPVMVVAWHSARMSVTQVTIGVTNRRVLVVKGAGPMQAFPYDYEGEHLPSAQKKAQRRGFFDWSHKPSGYCPTVKVPPFAGEEWLMTPLVQGFPEQKANLRQFARLFYFQWFYD